MPKCYTEQEKNYIIKRLKEEAAKCLVQYGIRRTTVDELVKRVKIPKGTFYLLYQSKELLLFEVILEQHNKIEQELLEAILELEYKTVTCEQLTEILFRFFKTAVKMPVLNMLASEDIEILNRKLPEEVLAAHQNEDSSMIKKILSALHMEETKSIEAFSAAFRAIYFATLHKDQLDELHYDNALRLLINGLVIQLLQ